MSTNYTYSKVTAANFNTSPATVARSATGSVYAITDTTYTTPLNMTLVVGGTVVTAISSDANGYFPDFTLLDRTSCVWKQAGVAFATVLTTTDPVPGAQGVPGTPGTPGAQGVPGDVSTWKPTTFYPLNTPVTNPSGDLVKCTTAHTSTSTYDSAKFSTAYDSAVQSLVSTPGSATAVALSATYVKRGDLVFSVKDYGALGNWNGTTGNDDTAAIQNAINAAATAGGGTVYFPAGTYRIQPQVARTTDPSTNSVNESHALSIAGDNITLRGAGQNTTKLAVRAYGGGNPSTNWQTVAGKVWRGGGIFITGGTSTGTTRRNIAIEQLEIDGGCTYTGVNTWPANVSTGDGWDITNKGVWLQNDTYIDNVRVLDCKIHNFRGEIVYSSGGSIGKITGRRLELYGTNGDCWSCSASVTLEDSIIYQTAGHGIEDAYFSGDCFYRRNIVSDCALSGISALSAAGGTAPTGNIYIEYNQVSNCPGHGIETISPHNMTVRNNTIIDCATAAGKRMISVDTNGGYIGTGPRNIAYVGNRMFAKMVNVLDGIQFVDAAARGFTGVVITDNRCTLTAVGAAAGKTFNQSYTFDAINDTKALIQNNTARGTTYRYTDQMTVSDSLVTGTAFFDLIKVRPYMRKNYMVSFAYRVTTAATNLAVDLAFYDASGSEKVINIVPSGSKAVGVYSAPPVFVNAQGNSESQYVRVVVTAGTANQVYVSASINEVPGS